ncbi:MAG: ABC transporter permease subunit [Deltaproteobacteria bacterium]|jgi:ABC-type transport system substrate-binding protein/ABC-type dipeptide/oligopeptide/nickel transport system permease subunit|nr:ABC transporter permease subunit [Deltaproteobacteria bacterium]MBW2533554.1 ABC transporter permease subunit [Deltaproteobacteria bacterium]
MLSAGAIARFRRNPPAMAGLGIVAGLGLFALLGPLLSGHDPNQSHFGLSRDAQGAPPGPSALHWLGTDPLYRDLLARLADGARLSLAMAFAATAIALLIGTAVGITAGYAESSPPLRVAVAGRSLRIQPSWLDDGLMRLVDVALAFPFLLLVTAVGVAVGRSDAAVVVAILGLTGWTGVSRVVRAKTMQLKRADYVQAAMALGASRWRIVRRHILPGVLPPLLVIGSHAIAQMILAEAVLSYLTVGIHPPQATWGRMLHEAEGYLSLRLSLVAAPGMAILLAVLGFTRIGDGLRDALQTGPTSVARGKPGRLPLDLAILALAVGWISCAAPADLRGPIGAAPAPELTPQRGGTLRVATLVDVGVLDPAIAYDEASTAINHHLFARLVDWDESGQLAPDLAESYEVLDEGRAYRFQLRRGVRFHDGEALTSRDVKRSLERTLHRRTPSPGASLYAGIRGFGAYRSGDAEELTGVRVEDDRTVRFELAEPDATFLARLTLAFAAPVCPSSGRTVDPSRPPPPCGAGPFELVDHEPGDRLELRRFAGYHREGLPLLDGIRWHLSVPATTQRYRFEAGELDYVRDLTAADVTAYQADPRWRSRGSWTSKHATTGVFLNTAIPPFDDLHLRRAVALALDPTVLPQVRPSVAATDRMIPPSIPGPERDGPLRRHDLAAALREMGLAGFPYDPATGRGGYPEPIDYVTIPDTFDQAAAEIFQQQLARIGIRIRLELVSYASWLARVSRRGGATMGWTGWHADFPDPDSFFGPILTTGAIQDEGCQNHAFFSNAELDGLVARARRETEQSARFALYRRAEEIVRDQAPWIPVYVVRSLELWHPYVAGYRPHPVVGQRFTQVWLHRRRPNAPQEER